MKLSGAQFEAISQAFLDAFDPGALEAMVRVQLDRRLNEIAAPGNLTAVIHDLIEWAEAEDRVQKLIDGACTANPGNARLRALQRASQAEDWFGAKPAPVDAAPASAGPAVPAENRPSPTRGSGPRAQPRRRQCLRLRGRRSLRGRRAAWLVRSHRRPGAAASGTDLPPRQYATGDALIDAAQAYVNRQGLHSLISFLKERLDTFDKTPTAAHRALARLPISLVFTANYDDLLERAYREAGKRVEVVVTDGNIPFMRRGPGVVNIVKLYGDLNQPDTLVLARQQYESFFLQRPQMVKLLETELARSDVLYLGWSHTDPHFNLVFGELLTRFGPFMRTGYAALFDVPEVKAQELRRKHIRLVELPAGGDRTAQLAAWLESLASRGYVTESVSKC